MELFNGENQPSNNPTVIGPISRKAGMEYTYTAVTTDPDGEDISYLFD